MDDYPEITHFMLKNNGIIICVASMHHASFEAMQVKSPYRLRGMATEPAEQGKGYCARMLNGANQYLKKETVVQILWCNARVTAFGFYEKIGFTIIEKEFDITNLGPHKTGYFKL